MADQRRGAMQTETRLKWRKMPPIWGATERGGGLATAQCGEACHFGMLRHRLGRVPDGHDRVADILVDGPVGFSLDNPRELLEVETEHVGQLIGGESFGDGG